MGLIKAIAYALLGYVMYELFLGLTEGPSGGRQGKPAGGAGGKRRPGRTVQTQESTGGSSRHTVGRGAM